MPRGSAAPTRTPTGLLRQYLPKGTDRSRWNRDEIEALAAALNARPPASRSAGALPAKPSTNIYALSSKPVLRRSVEPGEYSAELFALPCRRCGVSQSMGRAGSCFDNAAAGSFFSTLEWELFRLTSLATKHDARREIAKFLDWYNRVRRHSACGMEAPIDYEAILAAGALEAPA